MMRSDFRKSVTEKSFPERTSEYVKTQQRLLTPQGLEPFAATPTLLPAPDQSLITWGTPYVSHAYTEPDKTGKSPDAENRLQDTFLSLHKENVGRTFKKGNEYWADLKPAHHTISTTAQSYVPQQAAVVHTSTTDDLARYLARRDLVFTSLFQFDDRPESYRAFNNAIRGLGITASEELDLMAKWLGRESAEHVKRIRSVHISSPERALMRAWRQLQDCYASPEVIECALFKRLDDFPRISAKDYTKLRELGDLLMELNCAKEEGYSPGLSYLDTARGIGPIIEKLPFALQERWILYGSRYKEDNDGRFPPFDILA
ncbi:uncharacterized protein LOC119263058 isoform X2 [Pygocentrus nattereri]|uniref:uncharacterized protein LOC119263058 isoform X2 n=1 Tax=Pygocentrus nattereri TaxID=42514 RepID=UPI001891E509|nr:uncharacterized protein LOC119263058 isoform X2 [Pygocentrus nattereri]